VCITVMINHVVICNHKVWDFVIMAFWVWKLFGIGQRVIIWKLVVQDLNHYQPLCMIVILMYVTFSGEVFFLRGCLGFRMCFSIRSSKTFPCIFLAVFHSVSEKNKDKTSKCAQ